MRKGTPDRPETGWKCTTAKRFLLDEAHNSYLDVTFMPLGQDINAGLVNRPCEHDQHDPYDGKYGQSGRFRKLGHVFHQRQRKNEGQRGKNDNKPSNEARNLFPAAPVCQNDLKATPSNRNPATQPSSQPRCRVNHLAVAKHPSSDETCHDTTTTITEVNGCRVGRRARVRQGRQQTQRQRARKRRHRTDTVSPMMIRYAHIAPYANRNMEQDTT